MRDSDQKFLAEGLTPDCGVGMMVTLKTSFVRFFKSKKHDVLRFLRVVAHIFSNIDQNLGFSAI